MGVAICLSALIHLILLHINSSFQDGFMKRTRSAFCGAEKRNTLKTAIWMVTLPEEGRTASRSDLTLLEPLVICGPSGVGKNTLIESILEEYRDQIEFAVSHTTRTPRVGERNGLEYHFMESADAMLAAIERGEFIEYAEVHGNIYGTSRAAVASVLKAGKLCVLDIDVQGVRTLQRRHAQLGIRPRYVFIAPPSIDILRARLAKRGTESEEQIQQRVTTAAAEVAWGTQNADKFDSVLVNDDLDTARAAIIALLQHFYPHLQVVPKKSERMTSMASGAAKGSSWRFPALPRFITAWVQEQED